MRKALFCLGSIVMFLTFSACNRPWPSDREATRAVVVERVDPTPTVMVTPSLAVAPSPSARALPTQTAPPRLAVSVDDALLPGVTTLGWVQSGELAQAGSSGNLQLAIGGEGEVVGHWVYALAAPFPTLIDAVPLAELRAAWQGLARGEMKDIALLVDQPTHRVLERAWGSAAASVRVMAANELLTRAWNEKTTWAIVPFEALQPGWKVLRVEGLSPYERSLDPMQYGLSWPVTVSGEEWALQRFNQRRGGGSVAEFTNRDPEKLTVLVMTGVSALVRGTAWFMQQKGLLYPGRDVRQWLREADLTHVSNEASFNPRCPPPDPNDPNLRFCSDPKNIQLFEDVGVDLVELTGNHLNDFGWEWLNYSIEMFQARGWLFYGGGATQSEARRPILLENHGNRLAFIGCNPAGPPADWATDNQAGTADCAYPGMDYLVDEIQSLAKAGYLPIVTIQFFESYDPRPLPVHYRDFQRLSDAGAVIVSGSQAHLPQAMELRNAGFIHYGLGNLFFDQMDTPWPDTKNEFIDRHIFYQGRYLGVELLTATLEDYVKPRPMTAAERLVELTKIFEVSGWSQTNGKEWK